MPRQAWQVNPRSRQCAAPIAAAYKARTLRLITLDFGAFQGYAWTDNAAETPETLKAMPFVGASYAKAKSITIEPYPYHLEA